MWSSAGAQQTDENNRAFRNWGIVPSRMVRSDFLDMQTSLFGREYDYPIATAPVGVQKIFHMTVSSRPHGRQRGRRHVHWSTVSSTSIEDEAAANASGVRWYQLYWPQHQHNDITISLLERAKEAGHEVLVVTLDYFISGWRPSDLDNG